MLFHVTAAGILLHLFQPSPVRINECVIQHFVSECSPGYEHFDTPELQLFTKDDASGYITFIF